MDRETMIQWAIECKRNGQYAEAVNLYLTALRSTSDLQDRSDLYYSLAKVYYLMQDAKNGMLCCENVLLLNRRLHPQFESDYVQVVKQTATPAVSMRFWGFVYSGIGDLAGRTILLHNTLCHTHDMLEKAPYFLATFLAYTGGYQNDAISIFKQKYHITAIRPIQDFSVLDQQALKLGNLMIIAVMTQPMTNEHQVPGGIPFYIQQLILRELVDEKRTVSSPSNANVSFSSSQNSINHTKEAKPREKENTIAEENLHRYRDRSRDLKSTLQNTVNISSQHHESVVTTTIKAAETNKKSSVEGGRGDANSRKKENTIAEENLRKYQNKISDLKSDLQNTTNTFSQHHESVATTTIKAAQTTKKSSAEETNRLPWGWLILAFIIAYIVARFFL